MSKNIKETGKQTIKEQKEKGEKAIEQGEERKRQLQDVKALLDSIGVEDDSDAELIESLDDSYEAAGQEAINSEVQEVLDDVNQNLESNKSEIRTEKTNVEDAAEKVANMQGITDLAKSSASAVENKLNASIEDYQEMENETDSIEMNLSVSAQNILSTIESLFDH